MRCEQADAMMSLRLNGRLDDAGRARLDRHLETCAACRARWRQLQTVDRLLRTAPVAPPPADLRAQVMVRIQRRQHRTRRALIGGVGLALGAIALTLLILPGAIRALLEQLSVVPAIASGGPIILEQLLTLFSTLGRALIVSCGYLAAPLAVLFLISVLAALVLNGLWIKTLRYVRTTH